MDTESRLLRSIDRFRRVMNEQAVKIPMKHLGLLEIPEGKKFWELPLSHFVKLVGKHSYAAVIRALNNIQVWNRKTNPDISAKAKDIMDKLKAKFRTEAEEEGLGQGLQENVKVAKVGIKKTSGYLYFVDKEGNVARIKNDGTGGVELVKKVGIKKEAGKVYFVDKDGDISCSSTK